MKLLLLLLIPLAAVLGCSTSGQLVQPPGDVSAIADEYRIGVRDALVVSVWKSPELSAQVIVRPDGRISLPLLGDVQATGKTTAELTGVLKKGFEQYVRNPQVTVIVQNPVSGAYLRRVRVAGAIGRPLSIPHAQGMTVLDLVLEAGGLTQFANGNGAKLYRTTNGEVNVYPVFLEDILEKGKLASNFELMPSDVLTVPERLF